MFSQLAFPLIWAQAASAAPAAAPAMSQQMLNVIRWFFAFGDPMVGIPGYLGALLTYAKILGLFSLVGWIGAWVLGATKDRNAPKARWLDIAALVSVIGALASVAVGVLETTKRIPDFGEMGFLSRIGLPGSTLVALPFLLILFVWVERALWLTIARLGKASDLLVLGAIHMALVLGVVVAYFAFRQGAQTPDWRSVLVVGSRLGATYMGLVVLFRVLLLVLAELFAVRPRRLYAIANLTIVEATRRMWAPWVVLAVFFVILAFTHWFLQAPDQRPAEIGRLYINTLTMVCSLLITVMVAVLTPISLPQDIQNQTIYTVVSKPVRRLELVWGRMIGFMALVTFLMGIFAVVCLAYLWKNVNGTIQETVAQAEALAEKDPVRSKQLSDQADQLRTKMSARVPVKGLLTFLDSKGNSQLKGVDVGQELELRSHIEGATPATAIWTFGSAIRDPYDRRATLNRRVPVEDFLKAGTIEEIENRAMLAEYGADMVARGQGPGKTESDRAKFAAEALRASADVQRLRVESQKLQQQEADHLAKAADSETKSEAARKAGDNATADSLHDKAESFRNDAAELHSEPLKLEMTFTIYRTTKGRVGEPVYAEIEVINPNPRITQPPYRNIFPVREYYTNKQLIPASYLVGSNGDLTIKIRCVSATQYLGMAESDLYILREQGNFIINFCLGLTGIWLQAMVLTAIGVFAGTFLSWPMALLTTIAFFVAGQVAFQLFEAIQMQSLVGGGPFESLIRLLTHDNQMSDLTPTLAVVVAKTFDALTMPVLTRLAYIVPNFQMLDVTNIVAEGFAVPWILMINNGLFAVAYALPFTIGGYFILKNREVAA